MDWRYDKLMATIASQQLLIRKIIKYRLHFGFEELLGFACGDLPEYEEEILEQQTKHRKKTDDSYSAKPFSC